MCTSFTFFWFFLNYLWSRTHNLCSSKTILHCTRIPFSRMHFPAIVYKPCLYFFLVAMQHNTTMCTSFSFFWFFLNHLCSFEILSNFSQKRWPTQNQSLYFLLISMSSKMTMCAGFICFLFFLNYLCSTLAHFVDIVNEWILVLKCGYNKFSFFYSNLVA